MTEQLSQGTQLFLQLLLLGNDQQLVGLEGIFELRTQFFLAGTLSLCSLQLGGLVGLVLGERCLPGPVFLGFGYLALLDELQQFIERTRLGILGACHAGAEGNCARHGKCGGLNKFGAH